MIVAFYINLKKYFGIVIRLYPLLVIYYIFYLLIIDFVYWHTDLTVRLDGPITSEDCVREKVDYRLTQILIYFIVSANLLLLSKLPSSFINKIFFAKRLANVGINFIRILNFYSNFYLIFGFVLVLLLAFIKTSLYAQYIIPFHYLMLATIPIYLIYKANKDGAN